MDDTPVVDSNLVSALVAIATTLLTVGGKYLYDARKARTQKLLGVSKEDRLRDASDRDAATALRDELRRDMAALRAELADVNTKLDACERRGDELEAENRTLRRDNQLHLWKIEGLQTRVTELERRLGGGERA